MGHFVGNQLEGFGVFNGVLLDEKNEDHSEGVWLAGNLKSGVSIDPLGKFFDKSPAAFDFVCVNDSH